MKNKFILGWNLCLFLLIVQNGYAQKDFVQQILLDKPVTAGKLKVFPSFGDDANKYYYLPNKLRLAKDDNGKPKFLFLYYVSNAPGGRTEAGKSGSGRTGGYVHVVVGLHVLDEELAEAKQELKRINPKGVIVGPVVYRGGTMALVTKTVITASSGSNPDPNQKRVLGVGPAPVMEGDNVAVSFVLDSLDAKIMWESLQSSTPDLSFNLNMTLGGYQSPIGFTIDMSWDKIYTHKIFNAGLATPILKSEIGIAAQELKENASIKVTQVGEDANLQKLQDVLTNKLIELCFVPFGGEGSPNWSELAKPLNDGKSFLDRATEALAKETEAVERRNRDIRDGNLKEKELAFTENRRIREENEKRRKAAQEEADRKEAIAEEARRKSNAETDSLKRVIAEKDAIAKSMDAKKARENADAPDTTGQDTYEEANIQPTRAKPTTGDPNVLGPAFSDPKNYKNVDKPIEDIPEVKPDLKKEQELPSVAVVASYQQKKIRHSGHYIAEAKTYFTTTLAEPFGDNIGRVNCGDCIRKINTFDFIGVQREIVCFLDGEISNDFNKYINYVTVMMRKKHAGGEITTDEVRVDRKNFNTEGNQFILMYGWMTGDDDRRKWENYEYKTTWNFFGGATIDSAWKSFDGPVIPLSAPVNKHTVFFKGKQDKIQANDIRGITVRIYYKIAGIEHMKQATIDTEGEVYSATMDYLLSRGQTEYEYEIEWSKGNSSVKSARTKTSATTIFVDDIR